MDTAQVLRRSGGWVLRFFPVSAGAPPPKIDTVRLALCLLNGRLAAAEAVIVSGGGRAAPRLVELRLPPFVPLKDVQDLASLDWRVFPRTTEPVLPRILQTHAAGRHVLVACAPHSVLRAPFWRQVWGGEDRPDSAPEPDPPSAELWRCPLAGSRHNTRSRRAAPSRQAAPARPAILDLQSALRLRPLAVGPSCPPRP